MSQMQRDPETFWLKAGRQMGRELATVDVMNEQPMRGEEQLHRAGCHPAYNRGLVEGYRDAWTAQNPLAVAMGGN